MHVISHSSFFPVFCSFLFGCVNGRCNCIHSREVMARFWLVHDIGCIYGPFLNSEAMDQLWN